jgi:MSHA pilin protein MshC
MFFDRIEIRHSSEVCMPAPSRPCGFTLIELVVVVIVLGIVTAVVAVRAGSLETRPMAQAAALRAHLRQTQSRAIKSGSEWGMRSAGSEYWMFEGANPAALSAVRPLPGEEALRMDLTEKGVNISGFTVIFDQYGIPHSSSGVLLSTNLGITVQSPGDASNSAVLTIIPETGYVQ